MGAQRAAREWLAVAQAEMLRGQHASAQRTLAQALVEHPASIDLRRAQAGVQQQNGQLAEAEATLYALLASTPGDAAAAFSLARLLEQQGRASAAASALRACLGETANAHDANLAIQAIELLDDCDRKADAAAIADAAIAGNPEDARLHAYAGMLKVQLGEFEPARQHYLFALNRDDRAWEWHVPIGLSSTQRYASCDHPDFALFADGLQREDISDKARAELHFALGKAHDDVGDYAHAARQFREGNATAHRLTSWSRKDWRRAVEARLAARSIEANPAPSSNITPVFIVGMPRSGTTLLAGLLARHPGVCNRGELPWIARLAERPALNGAPDRAELQAAAVTYAAHARRDDAGDARWFIDKQPLNFRYLDLMLAMFPEARIIHCTRNPRDTALSLWMQCFLENVQGYSYDFGNIALVMRDCGRLMAHWRERYPDSIRATRYEDLVSDPHGVVGALARWIGLPRLEPGDASSAKPSAISTASLWQARQPVNTRSVDRWRNYAPYAPELLQVPA